MEGQPQHWRGLEHINYSCPEISPGHAKHSRSFRQEIKNTDKQMQSTLILGSSNSSGQTRENSGDFVHSSTSYHIDALPTVEFKGVGDINLGYGKTLCSFSNYESLSGQNKYQLVSTGQYVSDSEGIGTNCPAIPGNVLPNPPAQRREQIVNCSDNRVNAYTTDVHNSNSGLINNEHFNCSGFQDPTSSVHFADNNNRLVLSVNGRIEEPSSYGTNSQNHITEISHGERLQPSAVHQQGRPIQQGEGFAPTLANHDYLNTVNHGYSSNSHEIYQNGNFQQLPSRCFVGQLKETQISGQQSANQIIPPLPYNSNSDHNFPSQGNTYISEVRHPVVSQSIPSSVQNQRNVNTATSYVNVNYSSSSQAYNTNTNGRSIVGNNLPAQKYSWNNEPGQITLGRTTDQISAPFVNIVRDRPRASTNLDETHRPSVPSNHQQVQGATYVSNPNFHCGINTQPFSASGQFTSPGNRNSVTFQQSFNRPSCVAEGHIQNRYPPTPSLYPSHIQGYHTSPVTDARATPVNLNPRLASVNPVRVDKEPRGQFIGQNLPIQFYRPVRPVEQYDTRNQQLRFQSPERALPSQAHYYSSPGFGSMGQNLQGVNNEGELPQSILTSFSNLGNFNATEGNKDENATGTGKESSSDDGASIFVKTEQLKEKIVNAFVPNQDTGSPQSENVKEDGRSSVDSGIGSLPSKISPNRRRLHRSNTFDGSSFFMSKDRQRTSSATSRPPQERYKTGSVDKKQAYLRRQEAVVVCSAAIPLPPPPAKYQEALRNSTSAGQLPRVSTSSPPHQPLQRLNSLPHTEQVNQPPMQYVPAAQSQYHKIQPNETRSMANSQFSCYPRDVPTEGHAHRRMYSQGSNVRYHANVPQQYRPASTSPQNRMLGKQSWQSQGSLRISPDVNASLWKSAGESTDQVPCNAPHLQGPSMIPHTAFGSHLSGDPGNYMPAPSSQANTPALSYGMQQPPSQIHVFGNSGIPDVRSHSIQPTYAHQAMDNAQPSPSQQNMLPVDNMNQRARAGTVGDTGQNVNFFLPQNQFMPQSQPICRPTNERPVQRFDNATCGSVQAKQIHLPKNSDSQSPFRDNSSYLPERQPVAVHNFQQSTPLISGGNMNVYTDSHRMGQGQMPTASFVYPAKAYEGNFSERRAANSLMRRSYPSSPEHPISQTQLYYQLSTPCPSVSQPSHDHTTPQAHSYPPTVVEPVISQMPTFSASQKFNESRNTEQRGIGVSYRDFQLSHASGTFHPPEEQSHISHEREEKSHHIHGSPQRYSYDPQMATAASQPVFIMPTSGGGSSFPGVVADPRIKVPDPENYDSRIPSILKELEQRTDGSFSALVSIAKKVQDMEEDILKFTGKHGDQEYVYLEEMLTRQLLALDQILAEGDDEIRISRRSVVREVQDLLEILEKRAKM